MGCILKFKTDSLQGKAIQFLTKEGKQNIGKVFSDSSITQSNSKRFRNKSKLLNMLEDVSDLFKKHGLFVHRGDNNIIRRNANLFENLIDASSLVSRINTKGKELGFKSNIIGANKYQGSFWLNTSDIRFTKDLPFEKHEKIRESIKQQNIDYIKKVNDHFISITGRPAIKLEESGKGIKVTINDSVLQDFNSQSYVNYVNSMMMYLNNNEYMEEELATSPLIHRLHVEKDSLIKEKKRLDSKGATKSTLNKLDNDINSIDESITKLKSSEALEDIWDLAEDHMTKLDTLFQQSAISPAEFDDAKRKLDMWVQSGDFSVEIHPFLDEEEQDNEYYKERFQDIRHAAEKRYIKLIELGKSLLENVVNDTLSPKDRLSYDTILNLPHKINLVHKNTLSLNRVGQALSQFIHKTVNEANARAFIEAKIQSRELANLYKKVKDSGFDTDLLYQRDENNTRTGRLVHKFSDKFGKARKKIYNNVNKFKTEMLMLDPSKLFEGTDLDRQQYIRELEQHLGTKGAEKYVKQAEDKYEEYKEIKEEFINQEFGEEPKTEEQIELLKDWILDNSPVQRIININSSRTGSLTSVRGKDTFLVSVPKRVYKNGKETDWYDKAFNQIEANEDVYDFYNIAEQIAANTQAAYGYKAGGFTTTSLVFIENDLVSKWNESGVSEFLTKDVYNSLVKNLTTTEASAKEVDPLTGKEIKSIKGNLSFLDKLVVNKYKELKKEDDRPLTSQVREELMNRASDEIFTSSKDNLFMALNLMNLSSLSLQHKHNIEDLVNLAVTYVPNSTVTTGNDYVDANGNPVGNKYIDNMKEMIAHFLDMAYYNEGKVDTSSTLFRLRTREEKRRTKQIQEELQNQELSIEEVNSLNNELNQMGANVTLNTLAKKFMDFIRIKGLGWNVPAAIANITYGKLTNLYKALDGRLFNARELGQAERLIIQDNKKFNHVVENYSILGDILFEFKENNKFEEKKGWFFKVTKSLKPYALQTGTEKLNQGTIMIAMMLRAKVTDTETGEELSMWEAINDEGNLTDKYTINNKSGDDAIVDMVSKIKSQVEEIHGDYSNPLLLKNSIAGQALGMFKMWFFEAIHNRLGSERPDYIRGITTKGRYRTLFEILKTYKWKFRKLYSDMKSGDLKEVDIANMRVNFIEFTAMILSLISYSLLKNGICGDSSECKSANVSQLYLLNLQKRLTNEITFYLNPKEWKGFISNPTAAANILGDMATLIETTGVLLDGEEETNYYQRGFYEGRNKLEVWTEKQIPFINQLRRLEKYGGEYLDL